MKEEKNKLKMVYSLYILLEIYKIGFNLIWCDNVNLKFDVIILKRMYKKNQ